MRSLGLSQVWLESLEMLSRGGRFEQMPVAALCHVACRGQDGARGPGRRVHIIQGRDDGAGSRVGQWKWEKWSG